MANLLTALGEIRNMNADELSRVVEAVKQRRERLSRQTTATIQVGTPVSFVTRGVTVRGTVIKVNRKNVVVKQRPDGMLWRVPAVMLKTVNVDEY